MVLELVIETHFHADFLSGHLELAAATGATIAYGSVAETEFDFEMYRRLKPGRHELIGFFPFAKTHWAVEKFRLTPMQSSASDTRQLL